MKEDRKIKAAKYPAGALTQYGRPEERFESQYGDVSYREWCENEIKRFARRGHRAHIEDLTDGRIALVRGA